MNQHIAIVFYDLPIKTKKQLRTYNQFRKKLMKTGFYQLQKSVYIKKLYNTDMKKTLLNKLNAIIPKEGDIRLITLTLKQFNSTFHLLGETKFPEKIFKEETTIIEL